MRQIDRDPANREAGPGRELSSRMHVQKQGNMMSAKRFLFAAAAVITVTGSTTGGSTVGEAAPPPAATEGLVRIYTFGRQPITTLRIGDKLPMPVIFDTGTNGSLVDRKVAEYLHLRDEGRIESNDGATNIGVSGFTTTLPEGRLAGVPMRDLQANVIDLDLGDITGIVGLNSFRGQLVFLELAKDRVLVTDMAPSSIPTSPATPYLGVPGHRLPAIEIEVAGRRLQAIMDSGSDHQHITLPRSLASQLPLAQPLRPYGVQHSISGDDPVYMATIRGSVHIGPLVLRNPEIEFNGIWPNVGFGLFKSLNMLVDPLGERSWVIYPHLLSAAESRAFVGRYGIRTIKADRAGLIFQRDGRPPVRVRALAPDLFELASDDTLIRFHRDKGQVTGFSMIGENGDVTLCTRT
jgi:hypothetical protein